MTLSRNKLELLKSVAKEEQVDFRILEQLLMLTEEFPDLTVWGAKNQMRNRIERIINAASGESKQSEVR